MENHPRLIRNLSWGDPDYDDLTLTFLRKMIGTNDDNLRVVLRYVAEKCTNSGEDISSDKAIGRKIIFSPNIFSIPEEPVDPQLVSVMMPFGTDFKDVFSAISNAAKEAGFLCKRVDDIWISFNGYTRCVFANFSIIYCCM